jgi:hypothetical protein
MPQQRTRRGGICTSIFLRTVVDVTRLIPDVRTVDELMLVEREAIIQAEMFSKQSVDKASSCESGR